MRGGALCEQITSGDVSGCVAFWFVKSPLYGTVHHLNSLLATENWRKVLRKWAQTSYCCLAFTQVTLECQKWQVDTNSPGLPTEEERNIPSHFKLWKLGSTPAWCATYTWDSTSPTLTTKITIKFLADVYTVKTCSSECEVAHVHHQIQIRHQYKTQTKSWKYRENKEYYCIVSMYSCNNLGCYSITWNLIF